MNYQCPKSSPGRSFVRVARTYRYEPRTFLLWSWVAEIHDGYILRCCDHGCARYWRVGLDGVHVPAGHEAPVAMAPTEPRKEREPLDGEVAPALGLAVRRERV